MRFGLPSPRFLSRVAFPRLTMVSAGSENPTFTATRTFAHMPKGVVKGGKEELKVGARPDAAQLPRAAA